MKLMTKQECQDKANLFLDELTLLIDFKKSPTSKFQVDPQVLQQILPFMGSDFNPFWKFIDLSQVTAKGMEVSFLDLEGTNFKSFDPQEVKDRILYGTNLKNVDLTGKSLENCWIEQANFERTNVCFDPRKLINSSICGTNLTGATLLCDNMLKGVYRDTNTILDDVIFIPRETEKAPYVKTR